jgi:molybdate transport system substrate-binding protein
VSSTLRSSPAFALDGAIQRSKIAADTRTPLARVGLGVGIRAGATNPDLTSVEAFKRALLNAKSVAFVTDEPTGIHIGNVFERLSIAEAMKAKTRSQETVARVWQVVANGEAELGFGFTSNVLSAHGVELAGSFPSEFQSFNVMAAGIGISARQPDAAKAFINFLQGSKAIAVMTAKGLEPATQ